MGGLTRVMQGQYQQPYYIYPYTPLSAQPDSSVPSQVGPPIDMTYNFDQNTPVNYHQSAGPSGESSDTEEDDGDVLGGFQEAKSKMDGLGSRSQSMESVQSAKEDGEQSSPKKKPRITLARGGACVACRNRKLKCTGERPCKTCAKAQIECRYEEIQRRKPRAVLLEERVAELEALLTLRGEPLPPSQLTGIPPHPMLSSPQDGILTPLGTRSTSFTSYTTSSETHSPPTSGGRPPAVSLLSFQDLPPNMASMNSGSPDIPPNSQLELALVNLVLPHTPFLLMPVHPQRFLTLLTLPPSDPQRPHPALLYIMFAEAARLLENNTPPPSLPRQPASLFPHSAPPPMPQSTIDHHVTLSHIRGMSSALLERARTELDNGIRSVDRPFDLLRAAISIARCLYGHGRFIEGWSIPVARLLVSCGLHRQTGVIIPPNISSPDGHPSSLPAPYAQAYQYHHANSLVDAVGLPILRMRPVIIPPPRDEIDVAERNATFWAAKMQDWEAGIGWGWSISLNDDEVTTEWPWGWGVPEVRPHNLIGTHFTVWDLHDPNSPLQSSPYPDTTFVLAIKSIALLHRATHLFDLPIASIPTSHSPRPNHIPPLSAVQEVELALRNFRKRIPLPFQDIPRNHSPLSPEDSYDGIHDPWWILLHTNLYTAEMLMWKEMALHQRQGYESAVSCARAMVGLVQRIHPECWIHVDMLVALDLSLAARFLNKESQRLSANGQTQASMMAAEEAEVIRSVLARDYGKYLPMASLHGMIVQRVKEGWPEKEGEYERV